MLRCEISLKFVGEKVNVQTVNFEINFVAMNGHTYELFKKHIYRFSN